MSGADLFRLLDVDDLRALPDPSWLIDGVVPAEGFSLLFGSSGAAKSFLALDWGLSVAAGLPWFGHDVERRWVVYVVAEGRGGLKARVEAWQSAHPGADLSRIRWLPEAVNLLDRTQVARARDTLASLPEPPGLLVVDTVARTMVGGDENTARDVGVFVDAVDGLRQAGAAIGVHHAGKNGEDERGSSALRAAADLVAKVERDGRTPRLTLRCSKLKDAPEWDPLDLRLEPVGNSCVLSLVEESAEARDDRRDRVLAFVIENPGASTRAVRDGVTGRNSTIDDALRALQADGLVERSDKGFRACPGASGTLGHGNAEASGGGVSGRGGSPL